MGLERAPFKAADMSLDLHDVVDTAKYLASLETSA